MIREAFDAVAFEEGTVVVLDTGVLVACGGPGNEKFRALARLAGAVAARFLVPRRVHEELGGAPGEYGESDAVVDEAFEAGWLSVLDELDYTIGDVSRAMDAVRRHIGSRSGRNPDDVEQADAALAGAAVQVADDGTVERVLVVTTDVPGGGRHRARPRGSRGRGGGAGRVRVRRVVDRRRATAVSVVTRPSDNRRAPRQGL